MEENPKKTSALREVRLVLPEGTPQAWRDRIDPAEGRSAKIGVDLSKLPSEYTDRDIINAAQKIYVKNKRAWETSQASQYMESLEQEGRSVDPAIIRKEVAQKIHGSRPIAETSPLASDDSWREFVMSSGHNSALQKERVQDLVSASVAKRGKAFSRMGEAGALRLGVGSEGMKRDSRIKLEENLELKEQKRAEKPWGWTGRKGVLESASDSSKRFAKSEAALEKVKGDPRAPVTFKYITPDGNFADRTATEGAALNVWNPDHVPGSPRPEDKRYRREFVELKDIPYRSKQTQMRQLEDMAEQTLIGNEEETKEAIKRFRKPPSQITAEDAAFLVESGVDLKEVADANGVYFPKWVRESVNSAMPTLSAMRQDYAKSSARNQEDYKGIVDYFADATVKGEPLLRAMQETVLEPMGDYTTAQVELLENAARYLPLNEESQGQVKEVLERFGNRGSNAARQKATKVLASSLGIPEDEVRLQYVETLRRDLRNMPTEEWTNKYPGLAAEYGDRAEALPSGIVASFGRDIMSPIIGEEGVEGIFGDASSVRMMESFARDRDPFDAWVRENKIYNDTIVKRAKENNILTNAVLGVGDMWVGLLQMAYQPVEELALIPLGLTDDDDDDTYRFLRSMYVDRLEKEKGQLRGILGDEEQALKGISKRRSLKEFGAGFLKQYTRLFTDLPTMFQGDPVGTIATVLDFARVARATSSKMAEFGGENSAKFATIADKLQSVVQRGDSLIKNAMFAGLPFSASLATKHGARLTQDLLLKPSQVIQELKDYQDVGGSMQTSAVLFDQRYKESFEQQKGADHSGLSPENRKLAMHRAAYDEAIQGVPSEDAKFIAKAALRDVLGKISPGAAKAVDGIDASRAQETLDRVLNNDMDFFLDQLDEGQRRKVDYDLDAAGIEQEAIPQTYAAGPRPADVKRREKKRSLAGDVREEVGPLRVQLTGVRPLPEGSTLNKILITGADGKVRKEKLGQVENTLIASDLIAPITQRLLAEADPTNPLTKPVTKDGVTKTALEWEMERITDRLATGEQVPSPIVYIDEATGSLVIPNNYPINRAKLNKEFPGFAFRRDGLTNAAILAVLVRNVPEIARQNPALGFSGRSIPVAVPKSQAKMLRGEGGETRLGAAVGMVDPETQTIMGAAKTGRVIEKLEKRLETANKSFAAARTKQVRLKSQGKSGAKLRDADARVDKHQERILELQKQIDNFKKAVEKKKDGKWAWRKLSEEYREVVTKVDLDTAIAKAEEELAAFTKTFIEPLDKKLEAHGKKYTEERMTGKGKIADEGIDRALLEGERKAVTKELNKRRRKLGLDEMLDARKKDGPMGLEGRGRQDFVQAVSTVDPIISRTGNLYPESGAKLRGAVGEKSPYSSELRKMDLDVPASEFVIPEGAEILPRGGYWDLDPDFVESPRGKDYGPGTMIAKKLEPEGVVSQATTAPPSTKLNEINADLFTRESVLRELAGEYEQVTRDPRTNAFVSRDVKYREGALITPQELKDRLTNARESAKIARDKAQIALDDTPAYYQDAASLKKRFKKGVTDADMQEAVRVGQMSLELTRARQAAELGKIASEGIARGADWIEGRASVVNATEMPFIVPGTLLDVQARARQLTPEQKKAADDMAYEVMPDAVAETLGLEAGSEFVVSRPFMRGVDQLRKLNEAVGNERKGLLRSFSSMWKRSKTRRGSAFLVNLVSSFITRGMADGQWDMAGLKRSRELLQDYQDRKITDPATLEMMQEFDRLGMLTGVEKDIRIQSGTPGQRAEARVASEVIETKLSGIDPTTMTKEQIDARMREIWDESSFGKFDPRRALRLWNAAFTRLEKAYTGTDPVFKLDAAMFARRKLEDDLSSIEIGTSITLPIDEMRNVTVTRNAADDYSTNTGMDVKDAINRHSALSANRKYFDYRTLPYYHQYSRQSGIEALINPFYAFTYNARYLPLLKRGLMREIVTGSSDYTTTDPTLRGKQSERITSNAFTREMMRRSTMTLGQQSGVMDDILDFAIRYTADEPNQNVLSYVGPDELNFLGFASVHVNNVDLSLWRATGDVFKQKRSPLMIVPAKDIMTAKVGGKSFANYVRSGGGRLKSDTTYKSPSDLKSANKTKGNKAGAIKYLRAAQDGDTEKKDRLEEIFNKMNDAAPGKASITASILFSLLGLNAKARGADAASYVNSLMEAFKAKDFSEVQKQSLNNAFEVLSGSGTMGQVLARLVQTGDVGSALSAIVRSKKMNVKKLLTNITRHKAAWGDVVKGDMGVGDNAIEQLRKEQKDSAKKAAYSGFKEKDMRLRFASDARRLETSPNESIRERVALGKEAIDSLEALNQALIDVHLVNAGVRMQIDGAKEELERTLQIKGALRTEEDLDAEYIAPDRVGSGSPALRLPYQQETL